MKMNRNWFFGKELGEVLYEEVVLGEEGIHSLFELGGWNLGANQDAKEELVSFVAHVELGVDKASEEVFPLGQVGFGVRIRHERVDERDEVFIGVDGELLRIAIVVPFQLGFGSTIEDASERGVTVNGVDEFVFVHVFSPCGIATACLC
jgi:hypothetical protein